MVIRGWADRYIVYFLGTRFLDYAPPGSEEFVMSFPDADALFEILRETLRLPKTIKNYMKRLLLKNEAVGCRNYRRVSPANLSS